jgi:hypothetical protein
MWSQVRGLSNTELSHSSRGTVPRDAAPVHGGVTGFRVAGPVRVMNTDNGYWPPQKMLSPRAVASMLDVSERHVTDVRRDDRTFPAPPHGG